MPKIHRFRFTRCSVKNFFRWPTYSFYNTTINARETYRFDSATPESSENFSIDLSAKDHLREIQRVVVRHPTALDNGLDDAQLFCKFGKLLAATMNHAHANPNLV